MSNRDLCESYHPFSDRIHDILETQIDVLPWTEMFGHTPLLSRDAAALR